MPQVTVYSTKNCPYCRLAKAFLDRFGVAYRNIDVGMDRQAAKEMVELSGQYGVPVIVVNGEVIIGFDANRLRELFAHQVEPDFYDVIITGAGPAGLTAALYCARKSLNTLIISENMGGQALESWNIENYMGYRMVTGDDLMARFVEQVKEHDIQIELDIVTSLLPTSGGFILKTVSNQMFKGKTVILAQGKKPKKLDVKDEDRFLGRGLSVCATCDGPIFREKIVGIVGGGNSALTTAIEMSGIAKEVHLIVRSAIRADPVYLSRFDKCANIVIHEGSVVSELIGKDRLSAVTIHNSKEDKSETIELEGLFAEIGWEPNTSFLEGLMRLNDKKEIEVDVDCCTSIPGVFAAGDITNVKGKQIIIASGEGAKAALSAFDYLMIN